MKIVILSAREQNNVAFMARKRVAVAFGTTLLAASLMQTAVAAEHHRARARVPVASQQNNQAAVPSPAELNREYWRDRGLSFGGPSALR
jgi:hypothetical protein